MNIKPRLSARAWVAKFRRDGVVKSYGLGTRDQFDAEAICRDLSVLMSDSTLLAEPEKDKARLAGFRRKALEIAFGPNRAKAIFGDGTLPRADLDRLAEGMADMGERIRKDAGDTGPDDGMTALVAKWTGRAVAKAADATTGPVLEALRKENAELREQNQILRQEVLKYRAAESVNVTVSLQEAWRGRATQDGQPRLDWRNAKPESFEAYYKEGRSEEQYRFMGTVLRQFAETLPPKGRTPLRLVSARDVDQYVTGLAGLDCRTKRNWRNCLPSFFRWTTKHYQLSENPLANAERIPGKTQEDIRAIRTYDELQSLAEGSAPVTEGEDAPMRQARCRSGLMGERYRLRKAYDSLTEFLAYSAAFGLARRLGFRFAQDAWEPNPLVECSTDPSDFRRVRERKDGKPK